MLCCRQAPCNALVVAIAVTESQLQARFNRHGISSGRFPRRKWYVDEIRNGDDEGEKGGSILSFPFAWSRLLVARRQVLCLVGSWALHCEEEVRSRAWAWDVRVSGEMPHGLR